MAQRSACRTRIHDTGRGADRRAPSTTDGPGLPGRHAAHSIKNEAAARYAALIAWAVREMDGRFVPYSAAQKVLEAVDDDPQTFQDMPGAEALRARLRDVERSSSERRDAAQAAVRAVLLDVARSLGVER